jgi:hypothetical protein
MDEAVATPFGRPCVGSIPELTFVTTYMRTITNRGTYRLPGTAGTTYWHNFEKYNSIPAFGKAKSVTEAALRDKICI